MLGGQDCPAVEIWSVREKWEREEEEEKEEKKGEQKKRAEGGGLQKCLRIRLCRCLPSFLVVFVSIFVFARNGSIHHYILSFLRKKHHKHQKEGNEHCKDLEHQPAVARDVLPVRDQLLLAL